MDKINLHLKDCLFAFDIGELTIKGSYVVKFEIMPALLGYRVSILKVSGFQIDPFTCLFQEDIPGIQPGVELAAQFLVKFLLKK